jgi:hypothetical protein
MGFRILNAVGIKAGGYATRLNFMNKFARYLLYLRKNHGAEFVVAYLKAGQLAISKKVAHSPVKSLRDINPDFPLPRLANGLPSIIPLSDRRLITRGGYSVIRFWLTMFSIYRIISIPGKLKLNTITDPFNGNLGWLSSTESLFESEVKKWLTSSFTLPKFQESELKMLSKASPSHDKSWKGYYTDIYHMPESLYQTLIKFLQASGQNRILNYVSYIREITPVISQYGAFRFTKPFVLACEKEHGGQYPFGQLSLKEEAAGKVRVFAMVDYWTQISLRGLHYYLFDILKQFPNDGTFDQQASIRRGADKVKVSRCSFGYDLSAATDRLPLSLQVSVLASLFGKEMAELWADLLVRKRFYWLGEYDRTKGQNTLVGASFMKYEVGQPMGALSSWAMLALTHHLIVQFAYRLAYPLADKVKWFEGYELLGDDIVLFDKKVAQKYLELMESFGVPINLSKSVVANNATVEFAKVVMHNGVDVSALSWKLFLSESRSLMGRANIISFLLKKRIGLDNFSNYLKRNFRKSQYDVGVITPGLLALLTMLTNQGVFTLSWLVGLINNPKVPLQSWYSTILLSIRESVVYNTLHDYWIKGIREFSLSAKMERIRDKKEVWLLMTLMGKVMMLKQRKLPSTMNSGLDYSDVTNISERTLEVLLPMFSSLPGHLKRDLFDFFTMGMLTKEINLKLKDWVEVDARSFKTIDDAIKAIQLYDDIESHYTSHFLDKKRVAKFGHESPLRVLGYLQDLSKKVPPFVRDASKKWG